MNSLKLISRLVTGMISPLVNIYGTVSSLVYFQSSSCLKFVNLFLPYNWIICSKYHQDISSFDTNVCKGGYFPSNVFKSYLTDIQFVLVCKTTVD